MKNSEYKAVDDTQVKGEASSLVVTLLLPVHNTIHVLYMYIYVLCCAGGGSEGVEGEAAVEQETQGFQFHTLKSVPTG